MLISEAVNLVMQEVVAQNSETSRRTYRSLAKALTERWGAMNVEDLKRRNVQDWANTRRHEVSPKTLQIEISFINRTFKMAIEHGFEGAIPTNYLKLPKIDNKVERILEAAEEPQLAEAMGTKDFSLVLFAIHTGLRKLEQFRLMIEDVKLWEVERREVAGGIYVVRNGMAKVRLSKTGKSRKCPLNEVAAAIAHRWMREGGPYLFLPNRRGSRFYLSCHWLEKRFIPAVKSLGLDKLTWHCLRHTCATRALLAGATLHEVSRLLGHSSIHQTERYVHFLEEHLWPAARALCRNNEGKR